MRTENMEQIIKDAARYRWLRQLPNQPYALGIDVVLWKEDDGGTGLRLEELDAAIDEQLEK